MSSEPAIITVLCLISDGNRILLQNRIAENWPGMTFPGGHVEQGESFVAAVKREMREETGLDIQEPRICGIKQYQSDNDERYVVILFKTADFTGKLVSSAEGEMVWVDRDNLHHHAVAPDFFELLKVFDRDDLQELIYRPDAQAGGGAIELY